MGRMTYKELYEKAIWLLEHNEINGGEYDKMIEPLNAEVVFCDECKYADEYVLSSGKRWCEKLDKYIDYMSCDGKAERKEE